jgi:hypothetical protein
LEYYQLVAIGWGQTAENIQETSTELQQVTSTELQQVTLHTIAYESEPCQLMISSRSRQFCAGDEKGGKGKK